MAEIITSLEAHPYEPALLDGSPSHRHLQCQARYSPRAQPDITRLVRAGDLAALSELLAREQPIWQYMIQTSQAVDVIQGGQKINAMPELVTLGVNYRVAPQNSIPEVQHNVVRYIRHIADKYGLDLRAYEGDDDYEGYLAESDPEARPVRPTWDVDYNGTLILRAQEKTHGTPVSPTSGPIWDTFSGTIRHSYASEGRTVVPVGEIMTGNTDTRHYLSKLRRPHVPLRPPVNRQVDLSPNIYRWTPNTRAGSINIHTIDERILMSEHMDIVKFYYNFVRNFDKADF